MLIDCCQRVVCKRPQRVIGRYADAPRFRLMLPRTLATRRLMPSDALMRALPRAFGYACFRAAFRYHQREHIIEWRRVDITSLRRSTPRAHGADGCG